MVRERKELGQESHTGAASGRFQGSKRGHVTPAEETVSRAREGVRQEATWASGGGAGRRAAKAKALSWGCLPVRGTPRRPVCWEEGAEGSGEPVQLRRPAWEPRCPHCRPPPGLRQGAVLLLSPVPSLPPPPGGPLVSRCPVPVLPCFLIGSSFPSTSTSWPCPV